MTFDHFDAATDALVRLSAHPSVSKEEIGLRRVEALLHQLGDPHLAIPAIHITGTAGKGSTSVMAARILQQAGHRTGLFTSPHLSSFTERISLDGCPISPTEWVAYQNLVWPVVTTMADSHPLGSPTFFETLWAMCCLYFRDHGVACAVVEVGRGGRRDATTANAARVGVITNVGLEHTESLGHTVEAIAEQKAGIIKREMTVITAAAPPASDVIAGVARHQQATLWQVAAAPALGPEAQVTYQTTGHEHSGMLTINTPIHYYEHLRLGLRGAHQAANAACAVAAIDAFSAKTSLSISTEHVRLGLARAHLPGRLETVPGTPDILLDGAQTAAAVQALAAAVRALFPAGPLTLLIAVVAGKDLSASVPLLASLARGASPSGKGVVVVTEPPRDGRDGTSAQVAELAFPTGARVLVEPDVTRALHLAREHTPPGGLLVVAGSLFLVGAVRTLLLPSSGGLP